MKTCENQLEELNSLRGKIESLEKEQTTLKTLNNNVMVSLKETRANLQAKTEQLTRLEQEHALKSDEQNEQNIEKLETQTANLTSELKKLQHRNSGLDKRLNQFENLQQKFEELEAEKTLHLQTIQGLKSEVDQLTISKEEKLNLERLLEENDKRFKDQIGNLESDLSALKNDLTNSIKDNHNLKEEEKLFKMKLEGLQQKLDESLQTIAGLNKKIQDVQEEKSQNTQSELDTVNKIHEAELSSLRTENLKATEELKAFRLGIESNLEVIQKEKLKLESLLKGNEKRYKDQIETLEAEISTIKNVKSDLENEVQRLNLELKQTEELRQKIVEIEAEKVSNLKTIQQLESNCQENDKKFKDQIENLESELSNLKNDNTLDLKQKLNEIEAEKAMNLKSIQELEAEISKLSIKLEENNRKSKDQIESLETELFNLKSDQIQRLQQKLDEIEMEKALNLKSIEEFKSEISKLSIKLEETDRKSKDQIENLDALKNEKLKLEEDLSGLKDQNQNLGEEIKQLTIQLDQTKDLQQKLDDTETEKDLNLKTIEQLKSEMHDSQSLLEKNDKNFQNQIEILETEISNLKNDKSKWEEEIKLLNIQIDQNKGVQQRLDETEAEKALNLQTIQELKSQITKLSIDQSKLEEIQGEKLNLENLLKENDKSFKDQISNLLDETEAVKALNLKTIQELESQISNLKETNQKLLKQLEEIEAEKALQSQTIQGLELELSNFLTTQSKLEECMMTILNLNIKLQQVQEEKLSLEQLYEADKILLDKLKSESAELTTLKNENIEMSKQIEELSKKLSDSQAADQNHSSELKQLNEQLKNVQIDLNSSNEKLEEALKDYKSSILKLKTASNQRYSKLKKKFTTAVQALNVISSSMLVLGGAQTKSESSQFDALLIHLSASKAEQPDTGSNSAETSLVEQEPVLEFSFDELEFKKCVEAKLGELQAKSEWLVTIEELQVATKALTNDLDASKQEIKHLSEKLSHTEAKSKVSWPIFYNDL